MFDFHLGIKPRISGRVEIGREVHQRLEELDKLIPRESLRVKILRSNKNVLLSCYCEGFSRNYAGLLKFNNIIFKIVQRYDRKLEKIYNKEIAPEHCGSAAKCGACSYGCGFRL